MKISFVHRLLMCSLSDSLCIFTSVCFCFLLKIIFKMFIYWCMCMYVCGMRAHTHTHMHVQACAYRSMCVQARTTLRSQFLLAALQDLEFGPSHWVFTPVTLPPAS